MLNEIVSVSSEITTMKKIIDLKLHMLSVAYSKQYKNIPAYDASESKSQVFSSAFSSFKHALEKLNSNSSYMFNYFLLEEEDGSDILKYFKVR